MITLQRILIYPLKSCDGFSVASARLLPSGALEHDRQFALFDNEGQVVNAKRTPLIHLLSARLDVEQRVLSLRPRELAAGPSTIEAETAARMSALPPATFQLDKQRVEAEAWLSEFFGLAVHLAENTIHGFPDDLEAPGPTVISTATLDAVATWFPELSPAEFATRFRANLELRVPEPFWEDRLFAAAGTTVRFQIGEVIFEGTNPCQRCVVPSRDPATSAVTREFSKRLADHRRESLPPWADSSRFNHFYRLAINTRAAGNASRSVRVGDAVTIHGEA